MLNEVKRIVETYRLSIERNKKYYDYPFTQDCDHYYKLIHLQINLDVWGRCKNLIEKYRKTRMGPLMKRRSEDFEKIIEVQKKGVPGFITQGTEQDMMEYMRKLEWIIEELEGQLHTLHLMM